MMLQIILTAGILFIIIILLLQVRAWRIGTISVSAKQKRFRIVSGLILIAIMGMVIAGDLITRYGPVAMLVYWTICLLLPVVLIILSLLDLKEVGQRWTEQQKKNLGNLSGKGKKDDNSEDGQRG